MSERLRQATERIAKLEDASAGQAPAVPAQAAAATPVADETLQRTLLLAQKFVDQTKRESEAEATEIVTRAEERARSTWPRPRSGPARSATEAEQRLRDEVTRLEGMRGQLATDVENMARHLESERNRLRSALTEVLKWVEENVQPANSLMALRPSAGDAGRAGSRADADAPRPVRAGGTGSGPEAAGSSDDRGRGPRPARGGAGRRAAGFPGLNRRRPARRQPAALLNWADCPAKVGPVWSPPPGRRAVLAPGAPAGPRPERRTTMTPPKTATRVEGQGSGSGGQVSRRSSTRRPAATRRAPAASGQGRRPRRRTGQEGPRPRRRPRRPAKKAPAKKAAKRRPRPRPRRPRPEARPRRRPRPRGPPAAKAPPRRPRPRRWPRRPRPRQGTPPRSPVDRPLRQGPQVPRGAAGAARPTSAPSTRSRPRT